MAQANQNNNNNNDTKYTKIFVGGLAWKTTTDDLRKYFERFGEVLDANVVCETYPRRSKGYGFVIFRDATSVDRALEDPNPIIDGRRTNCNLASRGVKNNMNQPNQNGLLNQVKPLHQYQPPSPQHVDPYIHSFNWNPVSGQYGSYMYNNPCYCTYNPTQMPYYQGIPYMMQQAWQQTWHQTNTRHVLTSAPQRSHARINENIQEVIADVVHHDSDQEEVTKLDSDVDQQTEKDKEGENIGQDGDIKQDPEDYEEKINDQEDGIKKDVDEEINGIKKNVENQEVEIVYEQENCTKEDGDATKELNNRIEIILQDERVQDEEVVEDTT